MAFFSKSGISRSIKRFEVKPCGEVFKIVKTVSEVDLNSFYMFSFETKEEVGIYLSRKRADEECATLNSLISLFRV